MKSRGLFQIGDYLVGILFIFFLFTIFQNQEIFILMPLFVISYFLGGIISTNRIIKSGAITMWVDAKLSFPRSVILEDGHTGVFPIVLIKSIHEVKGGVVSSVNTGYYIESDNKWITTKGDLIEFEVVAWMYMPS